MSDLGNKEVFAENLKEYMEYYDQSAAEICKLLGIKKSSFSTWLHGRAYPRIDKIEALADHFHCKKSDLVENHHGVNIETRKKMYDLAEVVSFNKDLNNEIDLMSPNDKNDLLRFAKFINSDKYRSLSREAKDSFMTLLGITT